MSRAKVLNDAELSRSMPYLTRMIRWGRTLKSCGVAPLQHGCTHQHHVLSAGVMM